MKHLRALSYLPVLASALLVNGCGGSSDSGPGSTIALSGFSPDYNGSRASLPITDLIYAPMKTHTELLIASAGPESRRFSFQGPTPPGAMVGYAFDLTKRGTMFLYGESSGGGKAFEATSGTLTITSMSDDWMTFELRDVTLKANSATAAAGLFKVDGAYRAQFTRPM